MAWKNLKQRSLADSMIVDHDAVKALDELNALIDWSQVEGLLSGIHAKSRGEKAWPPLLMFKALLLQSWYNLSDPRLEQQLARDLLFRRFVALDLSEKVPDHSTFWRFRQTLEQQGLLSDLLDEVNEQLSARRIANRITKRAYRNRPLTKEEKAFNRMHASVRSTVERVFGVLKQHYGMAKARYLGLARNHTRFQLMCVAHNIKRGVSIAQASCV